MGPAGPQLWDGGFPPWSAFAVHEPSTNRSNSNACSVSGFRVGDLLELWTTWW